MKSNLKKMTAIAMLSAVAYILMFVSKVIPAVEGFLQYDAKDIVITIGGFIYGPVTALAISLVVSLLEFFTVSHTGLIGLVMNIVSTASFACVASFVYHKKKTMAGAFCSLAIATFALTAVMLLWNYYVTPLYMKLPRNVIKTMLPTVFLPFNLVKGIINSGFILFVYKPMLAALQKTGLAKKSNSGRPGKILSPAFIVGIVIVIVFIPLILHMANEL